MKTLGIIGGSGLYDIEGMTGVKEYLVETPFGKPSGPYVVGTLEDTRLVFLSRHGRGHTISPTHINYRANIHGMKQLGVDHLVTFSAVGSLKENHPPTTFITPDQFIDLTKHRVSSFFDAESGVVAHMGFAEPTCYSLRMNLARAAKKVSLGWEMTYEGTMVVMEGPQFSTIAESRIYRSWGADIIGMTAMPEAKLAREAEMCYSTVAMVTDYDCWHDDHGHVNVEDVVKHMQENVTHAKSLIKHLAAAHVTHKCQCHSALLSAIMSNAKEPFGLDPRFNLLLSKYNH